MLPQHYSDVVATIALILSVVLTIIKVWEIWWKEHPRFDTSYSFTTQEDEPDIITLVNTSPIAIQISFWKLLWKPKKNFLFFLRKNREIIDVTPEDGGEAFRINERDHVKICIEDRDKFQWGHQKTKTHALYIILGVHGSKIIREILVYDGR